MRVKIEKSRVKAATRFCLGQRVHVFTAMQHAHGREIDLEPSESGTVVRLLHRDESAWIELDSRSKQDVHPFPEDDGERARHVLAFPDHCSSVAKTRAPRGRPAPRSRGK